ncbi:MAG: PAS domain S-box protein [Xenococcaceae cyanobacterium]
MSNPFKNLDAVFREATDPILIEDLDGIVLDLNQEAVKTYGFTRDELIGRPIKEIVPPEGHSQADDLLRRCRAGEVVRGVEGLRMTKDGQHIPVLLSLSLLSDEAGEPVAIATFAKDITALRHAQVEAQQLSRVFMDAADPIVIEDLSGNVINLNREAERVYGWQRDELIGQPIKLLVPEECHEQADELLQKCLAGDEVQNVEGLRVSRQGNVSNILITLSPLLDEKGKPMAIASITKDITSLRKAKAEAKRRGKRQVWLLSGLGLISSVLAVALISGIIAYSQFRRASREFKRASRQEIQSLANSAAALFASDQQLDGLRMALRARKKLETLGETSGKTATAVEQVLRQTISQIFERNRLLGHTSSVYDVAMRPDGQMIASASSDNTIKLWQPDGTLLTTLEGHRERVWAVAFSPNGERLASASADKTIILWRQAPSGNSYVPYSILKEHSNSVLDVEFSPDGQTLASASWDQTIKLWDLKGTVLATLRGHQGEVFDVTFSPDGQVIASASGDETIRLWQQVDTNERYTAKRTLKGHQGSVFEVTFSLDGQMIATAGPTLKLWTLDGTLIRTLPGHVNGAYTVKFTRDGKKLLSGGGDNTIKLWQTNGTFLGSVEGHGGRVYDLELSSDNKFLLSASTDKTIRVWQFPGALRGRFSGHEASVTDVLLHDNLIISASLDRTIRLWNRERWQAGLLINPLQTMQSHQRAILGIALSPDGEMIASASRDQTVKLWNTKGEVLATLTDHDESVEDVAISPDGKMLASASEDNTIKLWNIDRTTGLQVALNQTFFEHEDDVTDVAFSPNGQLLASGSEDKLVILRHLKSGGQGSTQTIKLSGHREAVRSVAFSPDGTLLASAGDDNVVKLWKIERDNELKATIYKTLKGHQRRILDVVFSPDGQLLASASRDYTVKLWQRDGTLVSTLNGHQDTVFDVGFSADGQFLASGSGDRTIVLWNLNQAIQLEDVLAYGCQWIADYLRTNPNLSESDRQLCDGIGP